MQTPALGRAAAALAVLAATAAPALAHHAMDGKLPQTFMQGLLSGLAHPVIGPDHLAFIVAIGIAAALVPAGIGVIGAFLAASTAGVLLHLGAVDVPVAETLVAASVIAAGALVAIGRRVGSSLWLVLAIAAGLVHGYAFGEAIVGAERAVLGAYLVGIAAIGAVIAGAVMALTRTFVATGAPREAHLRTAGVILACIGVVLLAGGLAA